MLDPNAGFKKLERRDPKWLVSFADLMSLLFAMFVMLLSFSEVDSTSFKKNAGPISEAFDAKVKSPKKEPVEDPRPDTPMRIDIRPPLPLEIPPPQPEQREELDREVAERLRVVLEEELKRQMIELVETDNLVIIRFKDRAAFAVADRELSPDILPTLDEIAEVLGRTTGRIRVEGHTDDVPINTELFRSNWDLSAARAASVVQYLLRSGAIAPWRISAEGFADSRPLAGNDTPENRARNRRVEISIELQPKSIKER
ncbi:MAG: OmpA family protein [Pseudomonadota bacterium]